VNNVCHSQEGYPSDFFYMYSILITNLQVRLSYDHFTVGVLHTLMWHQHNFILMLGLPCKCNVLVRNYLFKIKKNINKQHLLIKYFPKMQEI